MKRRLLTALLLCLLTLPCAAVPEGEADISSAAPETAETLTTEENNRTLSGVLLLSTVLGAMVVSTLIFKGRDRTKYL